MSDQAQETKMPALKVDASRAKALGENIASVLQRIDAAAKGSRGVRLIAVSKLKPANDILALYQSPQQRQLHFGENYAQELIEKSKLLPQEIRWHMIGGLQTNKCRPLAESVRNLYCVSSVDTAKKADALEKGRAALAAAASGDAGGDELRVLVQVNTSGEKGKSGVEPGADAAALCRHIREKCPNLRLAGLMTIGAIARSQASTPETENEDFERLREARDALAEELGLGNDEVLELSMGMSSDFEAAIRQGSDEVRVGTTIFGERPAKKDAKIQNNAEEGDS
ncbi:alanine racemase family protein [Polychaeton citri CBS 116435]|uniref:Pyridoxal phosphate homeostasis protein n=1 Tax=Polychaeton citri CBS 116435 TaxID=1314669 RepID=A0A9P4QFK0_9PEZI|nr:alanine racemase family protein [Polychaeton citri CBS 116435]